MIPLFLFILGTAMGSFANAVAWRIHKGKNFVSERSECEYCHHPLAPEDLVPVLSWLLLRGRCRYCHLKLSVFHPIVEMVTGLLFVALYLWWPPGFDTSADKISFAFWLIYLVGMAILFVYDLRWQLLPDKILFPLIFLAIIELGVDKVWLGNGGVDSVVSAGAGIVLVAGFFALLYFISRGRWIGFGDVKLGVFMGLILGMPLSLFALVGSYYIAAAIVLPLFMAKVVTYRSKVAFGPFLLIATLGSFLLSPILLDWLHTIFL